MHVRFHWHMKASAARDPDMASIAGSSGLSTLRYSMSKRRRDRYEYFRCKRLSCVTTFAVIASPAGSTRNCDGTCEMLIPDEKEMFEKLSKAQPSGEWLSRMKWPRSPSLVFRMKHLHHWRGLSLIACFNLRANHRPGAKIKVTGSHRWPRDRCCYYPPWRRNLRSL